MVEAAALYAVALALIAFSFGYLLGSIPFGLIFAHLAGLGDVRNIGSGNIGATNVLRTGRKDIAALTLLFDMLKGTLVVLIAQLLLRHTGIYSDYYYGGALALLIFVAAFGAFIGHLYPVWLKFRGGKGVATFLGITLGFVPLAAFGFAVIWLSIAALTRYSSLSAVVAGFAAPLIAWFAGEEMTAIFLFLLALLLLLKHKDNIRRLLKGEESKIKLSA